jgi:hypothetical protein
MMAAKIGNEVLVRMEVVERQYDACVRDLEESRSSCASRGMNIHVEQKKREMKIVSSREL